MKKFVNIIIGIGILLLSTLIVPFQVSVFAESSGNASAVYHITKLPYNITKPGEYLLEINNTEKWLTVGIAIASDDVVLDGQGHLLGMCGDAIEIFGHENITIKNVIFKEDSYGVHGWEVHKAKIFHNVFEDLGCSVVLFHSSENRISYNKIKNSTGFFLFYRSDDNLISHNEILDANYLFTYPILWAKDSSNNEISYNVIAGNPKGTLAGIALEDNSNGEKILHNEIKDSFYAVYAAYSEKDNISWNHIEGCPGGILLLSSGEIALMSNRFYKSGLIVINSYRNLVKNNTVNGKPVIYIEGASSKVINNVEAGEVILVNCHKMAVENLTLANSSIGVEFYATNWSSIVNNTILTPTMAGIVMIRSKEDKISSNIEYLNATSREPRSAFAISLVKSDKMTIKYNVIKGSQGFSGISLKDSNQNLIESNVIRIANGSEGISLSNSSGNVIVRNLIEGIGGYVIDLYYSSNNTIYQNDFINDSMKFYIFNSYNNSWDKDHVGNYWSNYNGTDVNHDGIGDTPYVIGKDNVDHYPLMKPVKIYSLNLRIDQPKNGSSIIIQKGSSKIKIELLWTGFSPVGVQDYAIYLDGSLVGITNSTHYSISVTPGRHDVTVILKDRAGFSASAETFFTVKKPTGIQQSVTIAAIVIIVSVIIGVLSWAVVRSKRRKRSEFFSQNFFLLYYLSLKFPKNFLLFFLP